MSFDRANLRLRLLSAMILAPIVLAIVYFGDWVYVFTVTAIMILALEEWTRLLPRIKQSHVRIMAFMCVFAIVSSAVRPSPAIVFVFVVFFASDLFFWSLQEDFNRKTALNLALGVVVLAACGFALVQLRMVAGAGRDLVYYLLAVVWATDTGAFVTGKLIGGPKLAPKISPNKTWAGLAGGVALAAVIGYIVAAMLGAWRPGIAFIIAIFIALVAQAGDLAKSYFKRRAGVKDSGQLIPGHGGVLDRIDGLLFTSVCFTLFETIKGMRLSWW